MSLSSRLHRLVPRFPFRVDLCPVRDHIPYSVCPISTSSSSSACSSRMTLPLTRATTASSGSPSTHPRPCMYCVLGNNDYPLLRAAAHASLLPLGPLHHHLQHPIIKDELFKLESGQAYLDLAKQSSPEILEWIATLPLSITLPQYKIVVVHAGIVVKNQEEVPSLHEQLAFDCMNLRNVHDGVGQKEPDKGVPWVDLYKGRLNVNPPTLRSVLPPSLSSSSSSSVSDHVSLTFSCSSLPRILIISDVHGCFDEMVKLINSAQLTADDIVILVGDLIAKGPKSLQVLEYVYQHSRSSQGKPPPFSDTALVSSDTSGWRIVFGHDARRGRQAGEWYDGLDTGCCYGRQLTGMLVHPDGSRRILTVQSQTAS